MKKLASIFILTLTLFTANLFAQAYPPPGNRAIIELRLAVEEPSDVVAYYKSWDGVLTSCALPLSPKMIA